MNDPLFEGWKSTLRIGDGPEIPIEGAPVAVTWTRGDAPWPGPLAAGSIAFEATFPVVGLDADAWAGLRGARCPGCDRPWAELPPGHTWTSADGGSCRDADVAEVDGG